MTIRLNVLMIEDRDEDAELILHELRRGGFDPHPVRIEDAGQLREALSHGGWDIILCDYTLPAFDAPAAIAILNECGCDVPLVVITGTIGEDSAAEVMRLGASDFLLKHRLGRLVSVVERSLSAARISREARRVEEASATTGRELATLVERAPLAICVLGSTGLVRRWNPAAERLFGVSQSEILDHPFPGMEEAARVKFDAMLAQARCGEPATAVELSLRRKNGECLLAEVSTAPLMGPDDVLILVQDVTERKRLQQMLHQAQKLESIGQLAAGIAHEINTPMQFIGDNTRFLAEAFHNLRTVLDAWRSPAATGSVRVEAEMIEQRVDLAWILEEVPASLAHLQEGIQRVVEIVRAMKDFSHPGGVEASPHDLNRAIKGTLTISRSMWKYVAEVKLDLDPELPNVPVELGGFNQAILNLLVNAAHAIEDAVVRNGSGMGRITVHTRRQGEYAIVEVSDTGCGMTPEVQQNLFQPFFTTKGVGRGTGQGLAILRSEIVDRLGGDITVDSACGVGTTFRLHIPLVRKTGPAEADR